MHRRNFLLGVSGTFASSQAAPLARLAQLSRAVYDDEDKDYGLSPAASVHPAPYNAATPLRVEGVTTIATRELKVLLDSNNKAVPIDCREVPTACRGQPQPDCGGQTLSVPSALWLPGAGGGTAVADELQPKFVARLSHLSEDRNAPVVLFCHGKDSWLSVNAALRAAAAGYTKVYWYRGGRAAWRAANLPITPVIFAGILQPLPLPLTAFADEARDYGLQPVTGVIRTENLEAPTPRSVTGAETISTPQLLEMLLGSDPPVLIDVLGGNQTMTLPGAFWSPSAGRGVSLNDDVQQIFAAELARVTRNDKTVPVVLFCLAKTCWLSVNAAIRAIALGYQRVYWYRGGRAAWEAAELPMGPISLLSRAAVAR